MDFILKEFISCYSKGSNMPKKLLVMKVLKIQNLVFLKKWLWEYRDNECADKIPGTGNGWSFLADAAIVLVVVVIVRFSFLTLVLFWAVFPLTLGTLTLGTGVFTAGALLIVFSGDFFEFGSGESFLEELVSLTACTFFDEAGVLGDFLRFGKLWAAHSIANRYYYIILIETVDLI